MNNKKISVVIPTYNEERRIEESILKIQRYLEANKYLFEIIISDDGSKDATKDLVRKYQKQFNNIKLVENKHKGKAPAIITGIQSAIYPYVLFTDIDLSVDISELPKMLYWLTDKAYDVAIATREGTGADRVNEPFTRHLMGRVFNVLVQVMILPGINDTQCGFKLFKTKNVKEIFKITKLYSADDPEITTGRLGAYDVEILFVAKKLGYKIKEVPVKWVYGEGSKVHKFSDSYTNAKDVLKVRLNDIKGLYN